LFGIVPDAPPTATHSLYRTLVHRISGTWPLVLGGERLGCCDGLCDSLQGPWTFSFAQLLLSHGCRAKAAEHPFDSVLL
jgi:hypothetical protein